MAAESMLDRMDDPKQIVARGYDRIAERYAAWAGASWEGGRARCGELLLQRLPPGAAVLDLGCGTGVPVARELATRFAVTGVDCSPRSIALAKRNVPGGTFFQADMSSLDFPAASFDAVIAFYSIIHVPRAEHPALLRAIAGWLRPGGVFVASLGAGEADDGYEEDWLGAPMYWSHFNGATNRRLIEAAGLRLLLAEEITEDEDGAPATFLWVAAEKPRSGEPPAYRP
jgi:SAM-dependent methyltransferase